MDSGVWQEEGWLVEQWEVGLWFFVFRWTEVRCLPSWAPAHIERAGSGTPVLFAHVERAALNPPVVFFVPVWHWGPGGW